MLKGNPARRLAARCPPVERNGQGMHTRTVSTICKVLMWLAFAFSAIWQVMTLYSLHSGNQQAIAAGQEQYVFNIWPLAIACVLIVAGLVLFILLKKQRYIGLLIAIAAAVIFLLVALELGRAFPLQIGTGGVDRGLSPWKIAYRHCSMLLVPVFMVPAWLCERAADKADERRRAKEAGSYHIDLSGAPLFADADK